MRVVSVRVQNYRSILDSGEVPIDPQVTCLVGKNESGKTALLRALHMLNPLNPIRGKLNFDPVIDFPAKDYGKYRLRKEGTPEPEVVRAEFLLDDSEVEDLNDRFGDGYVKSPKLIVTKGYGRNKTYDIETDEEVAAQHLASSLQVLDDQKEALTGIRSIRDLHAFIKSVPEPHSSVTSLLETIDGWRGNRLMLHVIDEYLSEWLPKFFYFDEYSTMPGRLSVDRLKEKLDNEEDLTEGERAFLAFLSLGGADIESVASGTRTEAVIRELENAGIAITAEAMQFWTQNDGLRVQVRESQADPKDEDANLRSGTILNLRIENTNQYGVSSPFDERSRGFVWFFSFLAYFTGLQQEHEEGEIVLLLDEPGLSLHGSAQADFLRFINDRLALNHQVLYTTHSPFLVEPDRFDRVRTVEEVAGDGTKVSSDIFRSQPGTSLPILTKMGVELFQTLMVGPNTLLVEGGSDFLYLRLLSQELIRRKSAGLDERWVVVPVAGLPKFEQFFRLYRANNLNVAALMDSSTIDKKLVADLKTAGAGKAIVTIGEVMGIDDADIEDLIGEGFYLELVAATYALQPLEPSKFTSKHPRVAKRVEHHFEENNLNNGTFSHYDPAAYLRENKDLLPKLDKGAIERVKKLFERLNSLVQA